MAGRATGNGEVRFHHRGKIENASGILGGTEGMEIQGYEIHQGYSYFVNEKSDENGKDLENKTKSDIKCIFGDEKLKEMIKDNTFFSSSSISLLFSLSPSSFWMALTCSLR